PKPMQDDRGVAMRGADREADPSELEVQGTLPDARRRRDVGAEDAHADPPEATEGPKTVAVPPGELYRGRPVGLDADAHRPYAPTPARCREHDRDIRDRTRFRLELRGRLAAREAADVDAVDPDALGDLVGRAREREPEQNAQNRDDAGEGKQALDQYPPRPPTAASLDPD